MVSHYRLNHWSTHPFFRDALSSPGDYSPIDKKIDCGDKFVYMGRSYFLHTSFGHQINCKLICPHCKKVLDDSKNFYLRFCDCGKGYAQAGTALFLEDFPYQEGVCHSQTCTP